jgi:hypothetical protein
MDTPERRQWTRHQYRPLRGIIPVRWMSDDDLWTHEGDLVARLHHGVRKEEMRRLGRAIPRRGGRADQAGYDSATRCQGPLPPEMVARRHDSPIGAAAAAPAPERPSTGREAGSEEGGHSGGQAGQKTGQYTRRRYRMTASERAARKDRFSRPVKIF